MRLWPTCLLAAFFAAAPAGASQRAITRDGERIGAVAAAPTVRNDDFRDVDVPPELLDIVARLGSDDYAAREEATAALHEANFAREKIYAVLAREDLNPEQRHRLLGFIYAQIAETPRGAVGISMRWEPGDIGGEGCIVVERTIPGFDAQRVLQFHDRITHVDGHRLTEVSDFTRLVQSKRPGEEVQLRLQRARRNAAGDAVFDNAGRLVYDTIDTPLKLGALQTLQTMPGDNRVVQAEDDALSTELKWAIARFGSSRQRIEVKGGIPASTISQLVENDGDIVALRRQIDHLLQGRIRDAEQLHNLWFLKVEELTLAAHDANLTVEERARRMAVLERYIELISPFFEPE